LARSSKIFSAISSSARASSRIFNR
jgi:hypothetical protein